MEARHIIILPLFFVGVVVLGTYIALQFSLMVSLLVLWTLASVVGLCTLIRLIVETVFITRWLKTSPTINQAQLIIQASRFRVRVTLLISCLAMLFISASATFSLLHPSGPVHPLRAVAYTTAFIVIAASVGITALWDDIGGKKLRYYLRGKRIL